MNSGPQQFTIATAAAWLQLKLGKRAPSHWTVHRMVKAGRIPAEKMGPQWIIQRSALDEYIARRRASTDSTSAASEVVGA